MLNFMPGSISKRSIVTFLLVLPGVLEAQAPVPTPKVTGPIAATARPGDPSHNYPYGATKADLARYGYREDEFFIEGLTNEYRTDGIKTAVIVSGPYAYKARVIVRRPISAAKFNGTVILEWSNSVVGFYQENDWYWSHEHLMRAGYAYIGVASQARGIESAYGLKAFNPQRYASLDTDAGGKFRGNALALAFDIYSQAAQAAKQSQTTRLLGDLKVRNVIATGHSLPHLYPYYNGIQPLARVIDGFVIHGATGQAVRTDLKTPVFRLFSELEVVQNALDLPDRDYLRTWEVAGAAHADRDLIDALDAVLERDLPQFAGNEACDKPPMSRIPARMVQHAAYDSMKVWIEKGKQPPGAPKIQVSPAPSEGERRVIARDTNGNALGGIRLAQFAVPVATDTGENSGGQFCNIYGSHVPFDQMKLDRLYPSHAAYVAAVEKITESNLKAGFITKEDAEQTVREAQQSKIGKGQ